MRFDSYVHPSHHKHLIFGWILETKSGYLHFRLDLLSWALPIAFEVRNAMLGEWLVWLGPLHVFAEPK